MSRKLTILLLIVLVANFQSTCAHNKGYGEPCSLDPTQVHLKCDETKNLECSTSISPNVCACKSSSEYNQTEYDREMRACFHIPGIADSFSCQTDGQCQSSTYGTFSRCNPDKGQCECYYEKGETELIDNICFLSKPILFGGRTVLTSACSQNQECTSSALEQLSRCNLATRTCECFDSVTNGKRHVAPYKGKCVLAKRLEEFCDSDDECRVGSLVNAVCAFHPNYVSNKEKVCFCPKDVPCDGGATATTVKIGFLVLCVLTLAIFH